jgi:nucleoid-associated protein YgaU
MQRIERYGVIALVFLLVTILAVSLWGERKGGRLFGFLKRKPATVPELAAPLTATQTAAANDVPATLKESSPAWADPAPVPGSGATPSALPADAPLLAWEPLAPEQPSELTWNSPVNPAAVPDRLPPPSSSPPPLANLAAGGPARIYVVRKGETLGDIAMAHLGSWRRWTEISALNGNLEPSMLRVGMKLTLPAGSGPASGTRSLAVPVVSSASSTRAAAPARTGVYTIRSGDTLSSIAAAMLGDEQRWPEIAALNPKVDPNRILAGATLVLPARAAGLAPSRPVNPATGTSVARAEQKKAKVR